jgi:hypothetical protein
LGQSPAAPQQLWLVSTREAPRCGNLEAGLEKISYQQLDLAGNCSRWIPSDAATFRESGDPAVPTTIMLHGNSTDSQWAINHGWSLYTRMQQCAQGRPFRLVIWSWPADRMLRRSRPDVQLKVEWSDTESYYLARTLPQVKPGTPLGLIGYSLGCRSIAGALELLAGGQAGGRRLAPEAIAAWSAGPARPMRRMLIAGAVDNDWLEPARPEGLASLAVERILVTRNGRDRVLRFYSRLYGPHGPEALGYLGPAGPDGGKLEVVDVSCEVGRKHDWDRYLSAPELDCRLAWYTYTAKD